MGHLFQGFLTLRKECEVCHLDYSFADPADGPAFFVICFGCVPSVALALWLEVEFHAPYWVHLVTTLPFTLLTCIPLLRPLKGWLVASQYFYKAEEGRLVTPIVTAAPAPETGPAAKANAPGQFPHHAHRPDQPPAVTGRPPTLEQRPIVPRLRKGFKRCPVGDRFATMSQPFHDPERRRHQMFPTLSEADIDRLRRFGEAASYATGEHIVKAGDVSPGMIVILSGRVEITQDGGLDGRETIVTHGPGQFMGELAQLSARPSLVDAEALEPVEALIVRSQRLRDLMVQEAGLGERVMRALILRRVGLLESGNSGPIIIGRSDNADVLRLQGFLARNGQPHRVLDPDSDPCAKTLIERFHVDPHHLPIVLCPNGKLLRNPSENELARCIGLMRPIDAAKLYDVAIVGAGPAGLAAAVYAASEGLSSIVLDCRAFGGQAGASSRIENYLGFPTGISGMALMARAYNQAQKFGVEMVIPDEALTLAMRSTRPGTTASPSATARRCGRARWCWQAAHAIAASTSPTLRNSRDHACTTGPRRSRRGSAAARRSRWSGPAIPPDRPPSISRAR